MKTFGYAVTVIVIIIAAPIIDYMMEDGPITRTFGILLAFALAGIFSVINYLSEK